ncbi:alpha-glucosidase [Enterococcus diestrammenae]|nr:alpha-glucosidase [Enterococcus diestrammenae]KAF1298804.1 hypothetical protein BAU18_06050 [Enterococcus diestrammenae]
MERVEKWWRNAVGYQINLKSFFDSNNDGKGDLKGVIDKIPYIKNLGVDFVWLSPFYSSPDYDNGYDVSDFLSVGSDFGSMDDFNNLVEMLHENNIRIIIDLVLNHTSSQHEWFKESKKGEESKYYDYYFWENPKNGGGPPNNWESFFGGSVWTFDEKLEKYYFHSFSKYQPDLNWNNEAVRHEIRNIIDWWVEKGVDGFRIDAATHLKKEDWEYDNSENKWGAFTNVPGLNNYLDELKIAYGKHNLYIVGEAGGINVNEAKYWMEEKEYFNSIFDLDHIYKIGIPGFEKGDISRLKSSLVEWQEKLNDSMSHGIYLENHDTPRSISIFGDETPQCAKALATLLIGLSGTCFVYQGEEIGMTNYNFTKNSELLTEDSKNKYSSLLSRNIPEPVALKIAGRWARDHSRTTMQWDNSINGGFSKTHCLPLLTNSNYQSINVTSQITDKSSILNYYRFLIQLRHEEEILHEGKFVNLDKYSQDIFFFSRETEEGAILFLINLRNFEVSYTPFKEFFLSKYEVISPDTNKVDFTNRRITIDPYEIIILKTNFKND